MAACARMRFATEVAARDGIERQERKNPNQRKNQRQGGEEIFPPLVEESGFENANSLQPSFRLFVRIREIQDFRVGVEKGRRERGKFPMNRHTVLSQIYTVKEAGGNEGIEEE